MSFSLEDAVQKDQVCRMNHETFRKNKCFHRKKQGCPNKDSVTINYSIRRMFNQFLYTSGNVFLECIAENGASSSQIHLEASRHIHHLNLSGQLYQRTL